MWGPIFTHDTTAKNSMGGGAGGGAHLTSSQLMGTPRCPKGGGAEETTFCLIPGFRKCLVLHGGFAFLVCVCVWLAIAVGLFCLVLGHCLP